MVSQDEFWEIASWLIENLPYDILFLDREGNIVFANKSFCKSLKYSEEELSRLKVFDINPTTTPTSWRRHWDLLERDQYNYFRTHHRRKDGLKVYVEVYARFFLNNRNTYICSLVRDLSFQQSLTVSLELAEQTVNHALDMIYWINPDGTISNINDSVVRELGYSRGELLNMSIFDIDPVFPRSQWENQWKEIQDKGSITFETHHQRKKGTMMTVEVKANYLEFEGNIYNCAVVRDITERKQRENALVEALQEIKKLKSLVEAENEYLQGEINLNYNFEEIISQSESYQKVLAQVEKVAPVDTTVLITGETGTGKELLARAIHNLSLRKGRPLIKVNCAALPRDLIESELFGHEKGAFTGAIARKTGKFQLAHGGTIFLDEIGELPLQLQPKLLRVLQEGEFDPLGSEKTIQVDVRIIAATNRDLERMVAEGTFREDLFYRLNVFPIDNLPLRERKEDIPLLVHHFLQKFSKRSGKVFRKVSKRAMTQLMNYEYPGNIRELENLIERAVVLEDGPTLSPGSWLPASKVGSSQEHASLKTFEQMQRAYILKVLTHTRWKVSGPGGAAEILDMNPKTLFAKMNKLGISRKQLLHEDRSTL